MDSEKEISIKVTIADRIYPLTVKMSEEESVRNAVKSINDKLKDYKENFDVQDKEDLLAMCALEAYTEIQKNKASQNGVDEQVGKKVHEITEIIRSAKQ